MNLLESLHLARKQQVSLQVLVQSFACRTLQARFGGRAVQVAIEQPRPHEEHQGQQEGDDHPPPFQPARTVMGLVAPGVAESPVPPGEPDQRNPDRGGQRHDERKETDRQGVDPVGGDAPEQPVDEPSRRRVGVVNHEGDPSGRTGNAVDGERW